MSYTSIMQPAVLVHDNSRSTLKGLAYVKLLRYTAEEENQLRLISRSDLCKLRRRARGNMTQEEYAETCGVSVSVIQRVESDKPYNPCWDGETFRKILGVSFDFVMDHVDWPGL